MYTKPPISHIQPLAEGVYESFLLSLSIATYIHGIPALSPSTIKRPALIGLHAGEFKLGVIIIKNVSIDETVIIVRKMFLGK